MRKIIITVIILAAIPVSAEKRLIEDDIRSRNVNPGFYTGRTAEMIVYFDRFEDNLMIFKDVYGENVRLLVPISKVLRMQYSSYRYQNKKLVWGYDFEKYGEEHPHLTLKDIIQELSDRSKHLNLTVIIKFRITKVEKTLNSNPYLDHINIRGVAIHMVI